MEQFHPSFPQNIQLFFCFNSLIYGIITTYSILHQWAQSLKKGAHSFHKSPHKVYTNQPPNKLLIRKEKPAMLLKKIRQSTKYHC
ncbi:hypothetical protein SAMN05216283_10676 [Sunxiuqinia elliptica]|uniref:Uncharacterized protein n=1 Tax=Sunxiuqinia elliptica TaxID=655355 RepID=A0A1I2IP62_9BACT|nr:hypothetical protein SAMN05216283_10676 [Sunxiuqinia elliptica]